MVGLDTLMVEPEKLVEDYRMSERNYDFQPEQLGDLWYSLLRYFESYDFQAEHLGDLWYSLLRYFGRGTDLEGGN